MQDCKRILVPVDLEDFSGKIVPYVKIVAEKFDAEVHLLYVQHPLKGYASVEVPDISATERFQAEAREEAQKQLQEIAEKHFKDCPVTQVKVLEGHAEEEIITYVESEKMDLVVVGTHGRKAIGRIVFGSVAEKVLKSSPVPVLSLNPFKSVASSKKPYDLSLEGDEAAEELDQYEP